MGKSLVIKGADFSSSAIVMVVVSESQTALEANHYYNASGVEKSVSGITGIEKMEIPDGISILKVVASVNSIEPEVINCFNADGEQISLSGGTGIGGAVPLGTHDMYSLPQGTKYISYVYTNTYGQTNFNMGLTLKWIGY